MILKDNILLLQQNIGDYKNENSIFDIDYIICYNFGTDIFYNTLY